MGRARSGCAFKAGTFFPEAAPEQAQALREFFARSKPGSPDGTKGWNMLSSEQRRAGFVFASAVGEIAMSLGTILVIILIISCSAASAAGSAAMATASAILQWVLGASS
jgi:hypothetical protein